LTGTNLEVFTWPWLTALSTQMWSAVTLADVPDDAWDALALPGADAVWLMGVWERSPVAREIALTDPGFRAATAAVLPDASAVDVPGSPFAIRAYEVDPLLGGREGLAAARAALARRGLRLILDFVPNHVAPDHDWVAEHPEFLVRGTFADVADDRAAWLETPSGIFARGRDPYFPPWPDVLQLDPMSPGLRTAVIETLADVATQCDGVRCDMAMLVLDDVAERTWGARLAPRRPEAYWVEVTRALEASHPDFRFLAEAYWDREGELVGQGIDACYDKRLYDRLVGGDADGVRTHLRANPAWQARLVRFLENHDEPRAAAVFAPDRLRAAAIALLTLPGTILLHDGQIEGLRIRLPVHLGRRPSEPVDVEALGLWSRLLELVAREQVRSGDWGLLEVQGWQLLAWRWQRHLVVLNFSPEPAQGMVAVGAGFTGRDWRLVDLLDGAAYDRGGDELAGSGLYVALPAYGAHLFRLEPA
jgi:hypothetical protein